jgi:mannose-6-phosphate isomerase
MQTKKVEKPWGHELIFAITEKYVGKVLHIKKGEALSLQYHNKKDETIHIQKGSIKFQTASKPPASASDLEEVILRPGDSFHITPKLVHRMIAIEDTDILEVSTPELDDVVRLEDRYGRQGT